MGTPFDEKRHGVFITTIAFVMSPQAGDIFQHFRIITAGPVNEFDADTIMYYGFHPGFEPFHGDHTAIPVYHPYWDDEGEVYFKRVKVEADLEEADG